ncbi:UDP-glucose 6-dehydrogenase TuaD [compost metagenome]
MPVTYEIFGEAIAYAPDAYEALREADALVICTEWNAFRSPDFDLIRQRLRHPAIFDGRNLYDPARMAEMGFDYVSIGRQKVSTQRREVIS